MSNPDDGTWMQQALDLAERGRGLVEPNPLVGAVVVREGKLVGSGWHQRFGQAHAEVNALAQAGDAARGGTLYVTLEPCCHQGKTPPCTDAILKAGISRVVAACTDPFPQVAGQGAERLRHAGIKVQFGPGEAEARRQNAPYLTLLSLGRPHVHAKWAMTLDGKIASRLGDSKWISNEASRRRVHELRGRMDGVLVGIHTALADDPLLTARPEGPRVASRIILDREARLPLTSQLVQTARKMPTIVATTSGRERRLEALRQAGCEILQLPQDATGRPALPELLQELGRRRWTNLLVEGGSIVLGEFLSHGLLDEIHVFIAPKLLGGSEAKTPIAGLGIATLAEALVFPRMHMETIEDNVYLHGFR